MDYEKAARAMAPYVRKYVGHVEEPGEVCTADCPRCAANAVAGVGEQLRAAGDRRDWDECDRLEAELEKEKTAVERLKREAEEADSDRRDFDRAPAEQDELRQRVRRYEEALRRVVEIYDRFRNEGDQGDWRAVLSLWEGVASGARAALASAPAPSGGQPTAAGSPRCKETRRNPDHDHLDRCCLEAVAWVVKEMTSVEAHLHEIDRLACLSGAGGSFDAPPEPLNPCGQELAGEARAALAVIAAIRARARSTPVEEPKR